MVATFPKPAHPAVDHVAADASGDHARGTRGARAGTMMRQPNVGAHSALSGVAVLKQCLKSIGSLRRSAASAQLERGSGGNALPERGPSRLIHGVRLAFFESCKSL